MDSLKSARKRLRAISTYLNGIGDDGTDEATAEQLSLAQQHLYKAHAAVVQAIWLKQPPVKIPLQRIKTQVMADDQNRFWRYVESYGDLFESDPCIGCGKLLSDLFVGWRLDETDQYECFCCAGHPYYVAGTAPLDVCQRCYDTGFYEVVRSRYCTICGFESGPKPLLTAAMPCGHPWWEWNTRCDHLECHHEAVPLSPSGAVSGG